jgi:site-specific recombinase XerD
MSGLGFPFLLQAFFSDELPARRGSSPFTVASYRDTFRLLARFATSRTGRQPSELRIEDIDAPFIGLFLDHLETTRNNSVRTRNSRLAALHAFFRFVAIQEPALALNCQRILAIPTKRCSHPSVGYLTELEVAALLAAPDTNTWIGRRDRTLLLFAIQTGLRNSEITNLRVKDVALGAGPHVKCVGKGRKARCTPLRHEVAAMLGEWLSQLSSTPDHPVFPSLHGARMSADALQRLVCRHIKTAAFSCPSLGKKKVTPHTLRHTAAMNLLQGGVDLSVIALWLGHESMLTTQIYLHEDMRLKEQALAHTNATGLVPARYIAKDPLLKFLESL